MYSRQLDQMRSRSSAKAFLLLYICDLTRFCSVARSIGFLMTAARARVSYMLEEAKGELRRTIVVVRDLCLLDLLEECGRVLLECRIHA